MQSPWNWFFSFFLKNLIAINCAYWYGWLAGYPGIIKCRLKIWVLYFMKLKAGGCTWKRKTTHQLSPVVSASVAETGQHRLRPFCCAQRFIWIARCVPKASQCRVQALCGRKHFFPTITFACVKRGRRRKPRMLQSHGHSERPTFLLTKIDITKHSKNSTLADLWMVIPEPTSYLDLYEKYVVYCSRFLAMPHIRLVWLFCTMLQSRGCSFGSVGVCSPCLSNMQFTEPLLAPQQRILPLTQQNERQ